VCVKLAKGAPGAGPGELELGSREYIHVSARASQNSLHDGAGAGYLLSSLVDVGIFGEGATGYDTHYEGMHREMLEVIFRILEFDADNDLVVDIGGGTGSLAHSVWKRAGLKHPVVCVEPCKGMVEVARKKEGINVVHATAEEFVQLGSYQFTKVLVCCCSHLFNQMELVFTEVAKQLPSGGVCLVIDRHQDTTVPLFKVALDLHIGGHSHSFAENVSKLVKPMGVIVATTTEILEYKMKKSLWYSVLRNRYISYLHQLTDEEIEDGIKELEADQVQGDQR